MRDFWPQDISRLPDRAVVERELLHYLAAHSQPLKPQQIYQPLGERLGLSATQLNVRRRGRYEPEWYGVVQRARARLVKLGLLDKSRPGVWGLTAAGREKERALARDK